MRTSPNLSGSVDRPPFPWTYPYQDDGPRLGSIVFRPILSVALAGPGGEVSSGVYALVDSGCSHNLAAPWLAHAAGVDPKDSDRSLLLGIGGERVNVRFLDLTLRLLAPNGDDEQYVEWQAEVGFFDAWKPTFPMILGQAGFLDEFTVTMSHHARVTAVEERDAFDARFGVVLAP